MDATPESFAYRCLPLNIANAHGWEMLSPCGFEAVWDGGSDPSDVRIRVDPDAASDHVPVSLFGQGTLTFHVEGLFRTPPGWNLWVGGPPNAGRDGIAPLSGIIETDWAPYSFTMNWRFTRPHHPVRFEENEPVCLLFPLERHIVEAVQPRFLPIDDAPELKAQFEAWSRSRNAFQAAVASDPPAVPSEKWQKLYYRGVDPDGNAAIADHRAKLRLAGFAGDAPEIPARCPTRPAPIAESGPEIALRKRDWILQVQERMRALSPVTGGIFRKEGIDRAEFLEEHYAAGRPLILGGELADWPALGRWTPAYLREKVGSRTIEVQADRSLSPDFERQKDAHRRTMPFDGFIDAIDAGPGNRLYITAYNAAANAEALSVLHDDLGFIDLILDPDATHPHGMMWIGPAGTFTPLHHDLTNNLLVQVTGRKRIILVPPSETGKLYNDQHVFSRIPDLTAPDIDRARYPLLGDIRLHDLLLEAGDALFIPVGWWHKVTALDFSVSITHTNFVWPNDAFESYPG